MFAGTYADTEWVEFEVGPNKPSKKLLRQARSAEKKIEKMILLVGYAYSFEDNTVSELPPPNGVSNFLDDEERARVAYILYVVGHPDSLAGGSDFGYDRETFKTLLRDIGLDDEGLISAITHTLLIKDIHGGRGYRWSPGLASIFDYLYTDIWIEAGHED